MFSVMKQSFANEFILLFLLLSSTFCVGQSATLPPLPNEDPRVGIWSKNMNESQPIHNGGAVLVESYYTLTITREGDDILTLRKRGASHWSSSQGESLRDYPATENQDKVRCDGTPQKNPKQTVTCKYTSVNVLEGNTESDNDELLFHWHGTFYWRSEVSQDGKRLTYSKYKDPAKTKLVGLTVFDRVK